jgi:hypothetical protein
LLIAAARPPAAPRPGAIKTIKRVLRRVTESRCDIDKAMFERSTVPGHNGILYYRRTIMVCSARMEVSITSACDERKSPWHGAEIATCKKGFRVDKPAIEIFFRCRVLPNSVPHRLLTEDYLGPSDARPPRPMRNVSA